jgi:hypothetical protein
MLTNAPLLALEDSIAACLHGVGVASRYTSLAGLSFKATTNLRSFVAENGWILIQYKLNQTSQVFVIARSGSKVKIETLESCVCASERQNDVKLLPIGQ